MAEGQRRAQAARLAVKSALARLARIRQWRSARSLCRRRVPRGDRRQSCAVSSAQFWRPRQPTAAGARARAAGGDAAAQAPVPLALAIRTTCPCSRRVGEAGNAGMRLWATRLRTKRARPGVSRISCQCECVCTAWAFLLLLLFLGGGGRRRKSRTAANAGQSLRPRLPSRFRSRSHLTGLDEGRRPSPPLCPPCNNAPSS